MAIRTKTEGGKLIGEHDLSRKARRVQMIRTAPRRAERRGNDVFTVVLLPDERPDYSRYANAPPPDAKLRGFHALIDADD